MSRILEDVVSRSKQTELRDLLAKQSPFDVRRLAAAFVEMVGALKSRPQPRHWFDNVASPDRAAPKGIDSVIAARIAINAAIAEESPGALEETAARVKRYFRIQEEISLAPYHALANGNVSMSDARRRASKETHEALHAIWANGDAADEMTLRELDEAIEWLSNLRASYVSQSAQPLNRRAHMVIS